MEFEEVLEVVHLIGAGETIGLFGRLTPPSGFVKLYPSNLKGYVWFGLVRGSELTTCDRPVLAEHIRDFFDAAGLNPWNVSWEKFSTQPHQKSPFPGEARKREKSTTIVYFIQSLVGGPIKIGRADNVESRLANLQHMNPFPLQVLATIEGDLELEGRLHKQFEHLRLHGEWFEAAEELLGFISNAIGGAMSLGAEVHRWKQ